MILWIVSYNIFHKCLTELLQKIIMRNELMEDTHLDDGFYRFAQESSNSNDERFIVESMEPSNTPHTRKDIGNQSLILENSYSQQSCPSNNFTILIHSLCIQNDTRVLKEFRLIEEMIQLYGKYKAEKYILNQQQLIEKALILLRVMEDTEDITSSEDEILNLTSRILDHETELMCIKTELIRIWKEIESCRAMNESKRLINVFCTLKSCDENKTDRPLFKLLQQLKSMADSKILRNAMEFIVQGLHLLVDTDSSQYEPFVFRSSGTCNLNMIEVHQVRSSTLHQNDRFFVKLLVNGNLVYTSPIGIYESSKGSVRFDSLCSTKVPNSRPDICVQIYKAPSISPALLLGSLYLMYPQHDYDWSPSMGKLSLHLLPAVSSWYHFSATTHDHRYSGYIGVTTYFTTSVESKRSCDTHIIGKSMCQPVDIMMNNYNLEIPSFKPDQCLNFKEMKSGRLYDDFFTVSEPRRLSLLRMRSSKLPSLLNINDPRVSMNGTTTVFNDWKIEFESVIRQRPLLDRGHVKSFISLLSSADNRALKNETGFQSVSDIVYDIGDSRMSGNILSFPVLYKIFCPVDRRLLSLIDSPKQLSMIDMGSPSLVITLIAARNIPSRSYNNINIQHPSLRSLSRHMDDFFSPTDGLNPAQLFEEKGCVNPFFQVQFRGTKYFSKIVSRKSPYFKQTLSIPLLSDDESCFSPTTLYGSNDVIEIKLFDAYELGSVDTFDHHLIGEWMMPLKFLYAKSKVGGTFRLDIPEILIGYERTHGFMVDEETDAPVALRVPNRLPEDSASDHSELYENIDSSTYVDLALNIHPCISRCFLNSEEDRLDYSSNQEDVSLIAAMKKWIDDCKLESTKWIQLTATDLRGNDWIITRLMNRLVPPHSVRKSMRNCSHFVSLIALRSSITMLRSYLGRVSSCQQIIDLQSGDELEHTILLANYFLYLSKKRRDRCGCNVFMVFGRGHCDERVFLVGTEMKDKRILLWDALKGDVYSVTNDTWYPIIEVSNLVTTSHIYINLQKNVSMNELSFDIRNPKHWSCFPSQTQKSFLPSIQVSSMDYDPPDYNISVQLETEISKVVRQSFSHWRGAPCTFRDDVSDRLGGILDELEDIHLHGRNPKVLGYFTSISSLTKNREIFGFPLHSPFTNIPDIVHRIEKTEIHKSKHPHVEFAISVRVYPYESKIMSVWVFLCSLSPVLHGNSTMEKEVALKITKK